MGLEPELELEPDYLGIEAGWRGAICGDRFSFSALVGSRSMTGTKSGERDRGTVVVSATVV